MNLAEENIMRSIYLDKVVINIGTGSSSEDAADNARLLIKKLTNHEAGYTFSKRRDPELKLRKGQKIGAVATLRKKGSTLMIEGVVRKNAKGKEKMIPIRINTASLSPWLLSCLFPPFQALQNHLPLFYCPYN